MNGEAREPARLPRLRMSAAYRSGSMKFNQLERAVVVACAAVFLLATADGMGMTWVCPASGPGSCSDRMPTNERTISATAPTSVPRRPSDDFAGLLGLCPWDERKPDEQLAMSIPLAPPSQQGMPCPVATEGYVAKITSRLDIPANHEAKDSER
jgi:hypothetical protein